jgi:hypothetical protein
MNVQQLIEELQKHPPEMRAIVSGYEGGYNDLSSPAAKQISICLNVHAPHRWYKGRHDEAKNYPLEDQGGSTETALLIG